MRYRATAILAAALLLPGTVALATPAGPGDTVADRPGQERATPPVPATGVTQASWSQPPEEGDHPAQAGVEVRVESVDGTELALGVFRPAIDGCDWQATSLPPGCQLPVVLHAGPYFQDQVEVGLTDPPLIDRLVPHGYAVVQMALRGTSESGGCYAFQDPRDVADIDAVVDHLADQGWTNGKLGMIGFGAAGRAAWAGAATGNPHLETVVPISAPIDAPDLYFKNGTVHGDALAPPVTYYGTDATAATQAPAYVADRWTTNLCPGQDDTWPSGASTTVTGDASSPYWRARDLTEDVLANHTGSVWVVHGLRDWKVNPSQVIPFIEHLDQQGIPVLAWLGQWGHVWPDDLEDNPDPRHDFAQHLLAWFDHHLLDDEHPPRLGVHIQGSGYDWRWETSYPPQGSTWTDHDAVGKPLAWGQTWTHTIEVADRELVIQGLARLHATVTPTTATGGELYAGLYHDTPEDRSMLIGWAGLDLAYHDGGNTDPAVLVPGQAVLAKMQFEPVDAVIPAGHDLRLVVYRDAMQGLVPNTDPSPVIIGDVTLWLPTPG